MRGRNEFGLVRVLFMWTGGETFGVLSLRALSLSLCGRCFIYCVYGDYLVGGVVSFGVLAPSSMTGRVTAEMGTQELRLGLARRNVTTETNLGFTACHEFRRAKRVSLGNLLRVKFTLGTLSRFSTLFMRGRCRSLSSMLGRRGIVHGQKGGGRWCRTG